MLLGAVAQSVPDIDFISALWLNPSDGLLGHRGFTHSILFVLLASPLLGMLAERWRRPHDISVRKWILFFAVQGIIHLLIDGMNVYGVGWFEPFSHHRVSYNWIYVADPFYSVWLVIAFLVLIFMKQNHPSRGWWRRFGVGISTAYLLYCGLNKLRIDQDTRTIFHDQQISYQQYFTTPTPLNNWLWYVVASADSGSYIGYRSVFDREKKIDFRFVPRQDSLLQPVAGHADLKKLLRFSKGFYAVQNQNDTLIFNDLRFGQMIGWRDIRAPFAFYYYLQYPGANRLVVQRGRFAGWDREALRSLIRRIRGN